MFSGTNNNEIAKDCSFFIRRKVVFKSPQERPYTKKYEMETQFNGTESKYGLCCMSCKNLKEFGLRVGFRMIFKTFFFSVLVSRKSFITKLQINFRQA